MEIKSLSKLNSNEKASIEQLVFICNTFDKSKNILFLSNEFNTYKIESENKAALQLYSSSVFNIISQYEYYQTKI